MRINGSTNNSNWTYKLEVSEIGYSVQNRTSTVQVETYIGRANSQSYLGGNYNNSVSVTGASSQSKSGNIPYPTYINGGAWLKLQTFTFTVPNTGNPTTVTISSSMSSSDFSPSSCSASGNMQLTVLHLDPVINVATMQETDSTLISIGVPDTTIVTNLSKKKITLNVTAYDSATLSYKLEHVNTDYIIPSSGFQSSNVFNTDYTEHDISLNENNQARIMQRVTDSLGGEASNWLFVSVNGQSQLPNVISYKKPYFENTSTYIKRLSGSGIVLTDNIVELNLVAYLYKNNDIIGNYVWANAIGYKIWQNGADEPSEYIPITNYTTSSGKYTANLQINNIEYTKVYNYKMIITDRFNNSAIISGKVPTGKAIMTEYQDRVDFEKITVKGRNLSNLVGLGSFNNVDFDDFTETGIYYMGINNSNAPTTYCYMLVMSNNGADLTQIAMSVSTLTIYARSRVSAQGIVSWSQWKSLTPQ